jgi:hypothetical protein
MKSYMQTQWNMYLCATRHLHHKGEVKVNENFHLEQAMKVNRGSRGIALLFF